MSDSLNSSQMSKKSKKSKMSSQKSVKENKENSKLASSDNLQPIQSVRAYLEENVTAAIQEGMMELLNQNPKPENPLEFLGNFLIEKSKKK